jgi:hypothetical protein
MAALASGDSWQPSGPGLVVPVILVFLYHALDYPATGNFPLVVPLFTAA